MKAYVCTRNGYELLKLETETLNSWDWELDNLALPAKMRPRRDDDVHIAAENYF